MLKIHTYIDGVRVRATIRYEDIAWYHADPAGADIHTVIHMLDGTALLVDLPYDDLDRAYTEWVSRSKEDIFFTLN